MMRDQALNQKSISRLMNLQKTKERNGHRTTGSNTGRKSATEGSWHQWDPIYKETKEVFVKKRSNESMSHAYLTGFLYKYLQDELGNDQVTLYQTKLPDIVFDVSGFKWAIEIETGSQYRKNQKELKEKVKLNNKKFNGAWFFVVTNKNMASKYRQFHETIGRNHLPRRQKRTGFRMTPPKNRGWKQTTTSFINKTPQNKGGVEGCYRRQKTTKQTIFHTQILLCKYTITLLRENFLELHLL